MGRVSAKVALVTGAALGIGKATALLLAREGARVVVADMKAQEGHAVVAEIEAAGGEALFVPLNVTVEEDWSKAMAAIKARFGRLDIAVNNAGIAYTGTVESTSLADWRRVQAVNLDGVFLGTRYAVEAMKPQGSGSIINLSSIEGLVGDPTLAAYNASKGGVRLFTKSAALHCARSGYKIRVNSVHPGYIWTPMVQGLTSGTPDQEAARQKLIDLHPLGHLGEADDIAYGILFLASDESKFMTGSELVIDGGYTAQ
ncbi:3-beta hydroxysteroid dehydrogenase [Komagataeibacter rhaeticus]|uniref:Glucose 1-dehydrogenase n=1 Tax=Komagataeibacter rhaeticus TaxID=215221 RepID=A0A181C8Z6_9PROT|nr:glucose 1-dehydrogenase [Komagataeibacter rhaeticus]ATU72201.1 3-beta hydroxysteroid dehydrogenase [Komagataeibacter xylinus]KDU96306.1 3-beta hydroxysteroid dehydrogenase [Komagataeibacter rhaeticus AF1]MBL7239527.1 glucose 1-dehydrogenase [Komagataeibacter rhaeticus]PYD53518.1 3-beta hydroxysteroid dehydrogenase [Komagataeibacter rhaeticus]QIP34919.1 glucose 1-dehydrogenase [Komagataeibacter rhaeticus]